MKRDVKTHESYGIIDIARFTGNGSQFFGSDLIHNGGISITIKKGEVERRLSKEWFFGHQEIIRVELSNNQFVDAITSGMNTSGVPCTIKHLNGIRVEQTQHVEDKKEVFRNEMKDTNQEYKNKIDSILEMLDGNIGKRKADQIRHELDVLKNHIGSNTNFVMNSFNEAMEKTVTEAKHSIANYIDHKVNSLGIEAMKNEVSIQIENE